MTTRRWRALGAAVGTAVAIGIAALPWTGLEAWRAYPAAVAAFVARPTTGVTAYQTTVGFLRHWCLPEGSPLGTACPVTATIVPLGLVALAAAGTAIAARDAAPLLASAAGACVSVLCLPIAEDHQFVLLAAPLFALVVTTPRWAWLAVALLFLVPARLTSERFLAGWLSLFAYPRLYATWLLWALLIDAIRRARAAGFCDQQRRAQPARCPAPATR